jgi:hypothetical protein
VTWFVERSRSTLFASASAGLVALCLLAAACGGSPTSHVAQLGSAADDTRTSPSTASGQSDHVNQALAFARCMRSHGVPNFPDPNSQGDFVPFHTGVSKHISAAANDACQHLLTNGGTATPQQLQQKLAFGVEVAQCLRAHGYAKFPDPTHLGPQNLPPGIDLNSPRFQVAETGCEQHAGKALGLP